MTINGERPAVERVNGQPRQPVALWAAYEADVAAHICGPILVKLVVVFVLFQLTCCVTSAVCCFPLLLFHKYKQIIKALIN